MMRLETIDKIFYLTPVELVLLHGVESPKLTQVVSPQPISSARQFNHPVNHFLFFSFSNQVFSPTILSVSRCAPKTFAPHWGSTVL